jgi:NADPH:quinone reductase-like Zn-dependent oxidoreductase
MHKAFEASRFRPMIGKVFEFDQFKEAMDYSMGSDLLGKIVIKIAKE